MSLTQTKTYAICTIRNTPELPVHCIVWARALFDCLFGSIDDTSNVLYDLIYPLRIKLQNEENKENLYSIIKDIYIKLYIYGIEEQAKIIERQGTIKIPLPLPYPPLLNTFIIDKNILNTCYSEDPIDPIDTLIKIFIYCIEYMYINKKNEISKIEFTKDDPIHIKFIYASSVLRMIAYNIKPINEFECKGIVGSIIHAIVTTNAIIAGYATRFAIQIYNKYIKNINKDINICKIPTLQQVNYIGITSNSNNIITNDSAFNSCNLQCFCTYPIFTLYISSMDIIIKELLIIISDNFNFNDFTIDTLLSNKSFGFYTDLLESEHDTIDTNDNIIFLKRKLNDPVTTLNYGSIIEICDADTGIKILIRLVSTDKQTKSFSSSPWWISTSIDDIETKYGTTLYNTIQYHLSGPFSYIKKKEDPQVLSIDEKNIDINNCIDDTDDLIVYHDNSNEDSTIFIDSDSDGDGDGDSDINQRSQKYQRQV